MDKIRVLLTIPNFDTAGSGKVVYDLASGLDKSIFDVEIACSSDKGKFFKIVEELGLKIHIIKTTTNYRPLASLPFRIFKIARFLKKNKFAIIHSWHWSSDWTEALAARIAGAKWVYTKKSMFWGSPRSWRLRSKLATFITTINPDMQSQFYKGYKNVRLLPLGLDTEYYSIQEKKYSYEDISYSQDDFVVVSVVNLIKVKGIEVLIDAIKMIDDKNVKLLIVGNYDSDYGRAIYQKIIDESLTDRIRMTGKVLDVRPYIALGDVFTIPTNFPGEGMPMAPVEAMSSGKIVIGSDTPGVNYILDGFKDLLVPPGDVAAIAGKIQFVRQMPESERKELEQKIRSKVCEEYSIKTFIRNYANLYKELC
ncbi:MAG: glycosyltransferase family 4 protein [Flavipsychrobacter sp.]